MTETTKPSSKRSETHTSANVVARPRLAAKLVEVAAAIGGVEKRGKNKAQHYDYVMAEDVIKAVRGELLSRGVLLVPSVVETTEEAVEVGNNRSPMRMATVVMRYDLIDTESDEREHALEQLRVQFRGVGMDSGDKAIYKAYTACLKYFLIQLFQIPIGEDPEQDNPGHGGASSAPATKVSGRAAQSDGPPLSGEQKQKLIKVAKEHGAEAPWQFYRVVEWVGETYYDRMPASKMGQLVAIFEKDEWQEALTRLALAATEAGDGSDKQDWAKTVLGRYPEA